MSHYRRETSLSEENFSAKALDAIKKAKAKMQARMTKRNPAGKGARAESSEA